MSVLLILAIAATLRFRDFGAGVLREQVERLIAKDDQPLSASDAAKEEEKIRKLTDKRKSESEKDRQKRQEKDAKEREQGRQFVREVADAYNFRMVGIEALKGRETYVIDAEPRSGYQPHLKKRLLEKGSSTVAVLLGRQVLGQRAEAEATNRPIPVIVLPQKVF